MQKLNVGDFDPQRLPKDILIEILSRTARDTWSIALVCKLWSELVKLERYWYKLVYAKIAAIIGDQIDKERLGLIDVFCTAPYDLHISQIEPFSFRQRLEWMFSSKLEQVEPVTRVRHQCAKLNASYHSFVLVDSGSGKGIAWIWDKTDRTDFAVEFGYYYYAGDDRHYEYADNTYLRWFPIHPTLHKRIQKPGPKYIYEIWDPDRKKMWRGRAMTMINAVTKAKNKVPPEDAYDFGESGVGVWYDLNDHTTGNLERHRRFFDAKNK